jgi:hypothetical protein
LSSPSAERIAVTVQPTAAGHVADVTVRDHTTTTHRVRVSEEERERYGAADVTDLVRRSFEFLLSREPNTSILGAFDLSTIERYFPDYRDAIRGSSRS